MRCCLMFGLYLLLGCLRVCLEFVCGDWWLVWCLLDVGGFDLCVLRCVGGLICILGFDLCL